MNGVLFCVDFFENTIFLFYSEMMSQNMIDRMAGMIKWWHSLVSNWNGNSLNSQIMCRTVFYTTIIIFCLYKFIKAKMNWKWKVVISITWFIHIIKMSLNKNKCIGTSGGRDWHIPITNSNCRSRRIAASWQEAIIIPKKALFTLKWLQ